MGWKTRTQGTGRQIGVRFPTAEKKKLPHKLVAFRRGHRPFSISKVTFDPASVGKAGHISFSFEGNEIRNDIIMVRHDDRVGQFDISQSVVYVDDDVPQKYQKYLAMHESLESYFKKKLGLNEETSGHTLAEQIERREFLKSHTKEDWADYCKTVRFVSKLESGKRHEAMIAKARREILELGKN